MLCCVIVKCGRPAGIDPLGTLLHREIWHRRGGVGVGVGGRTAPLWPLLAEISVQKLATGIGPDPLSDAVSCCGNGRMNSRIVLQLS